MNEENEINELVSEEVESSSEKITIRQPITPQMLATRKIRKMFGIRLQPIVRESPKIGRNEPCPCGSGKKYKHCCINN